MRDQRKLVSKITQKRIEKKEENENGKRGNTNKPRTKVLETVHVAPEATQSNRILRESRAVNYKEEIPP